MHGEYHKISIKSIDKNKNFSQKTQIYKLSTKIITKNYVDKPLKNCILRLNVLI